VLLSLHECPVGQISQVVDFVFSENVPALHAMQVGRPGMSW